MTAPSLRHPLRFAAAVVLCVVVSAPMAAAAARPRGRPLYTGCPSERYGGDCGGLCTCDARLYDCDDGVSGDGGCICKVGLDAACGLPAQASRVVCTTPGTLACVEFDAAYYALLPLDNDTARGTRQVLTAARAAVRPHPLHAPLVVAATDTEALREIGLHGETARVDADILALARSARPQDVARVAALPRTTHDVATYAHSYGGIQFGRWAGQLGDGRCVSVGHARGVGAGQRATPTLLEVQLKGAGRTPFSRFGDGRAALANSVREFLAGAALEAGHIPATHAPALVGSGSYIVRDELYEGRAAYIPAGLLFRTAPTFLRFGSVQLAQQRLGARGVHAMLRLAGRAVDQLETEGLTRPARLALATLLHGRADAGGRTASSSDRGADRSASGRGGEQPIHDAPPDPEVLDPHDCFFLANWSRGGGRGGEADGSDEAARCPLATSVDDAVVRALVQEGVINGGARFAGEGDGDGSGGGDSVDDAVKLSTDNVACFLDRLVRRFAALAAAWQAAGFAHGVLNTDNMALAGLTIDLNVFGYISAWDRDWAPNHIDDDGRYAFGRQADIVHWNLQRLADALAARGPLHSAGGATPLVPPDTADAIVANYPARYRRCFAERMGYRLGLVGDAAFSARTGAGAADDAAAAAAASPTKTATPAHTGLEAAVAATGVAEEENEKNEKNEGGTEEEEVCYRHESTHDDDDDDDPPSLYDEPYPRDSWLVSGLLDWLAAYRGDYHAAMRGIVEYAREEDRAMLDTAAYFEGASASASADANAEEGDACTRLLETALVDAPHLAGRVADVVRRSGAVPEDAAARGLVAWLRDYAGVRCAERMAFASHGGPQPAWVRAFATQVDRANPRYILRTPALRALAQGAPHNRDAVEAVLRLLREQPEGGDGAEEQWAARLREVPPSAHRQDKTSCGAQ